jgi:DNA polymerase-3 subunit delta'
MLLGQDRAIATFRSARAGGRLHHAWLLTGPEGVGKRCFADLAVRALLADADWEVETDHPAARLLAAGSHLDHRVLLPPAEGKGAATASIPVDAVRALRGFLHETPALGRWRTVIIDPVDALRPDAANALLKELEEPRGATIFFLVSSAPHRLLPTIRSRCRILRFQRLAEPELLRVLREVHPDLSSQDARQIAALADGAPGLACRLAEPDARALMGQLETLAGPQDALGLARALQPAAAAPAFALLCQLAPARIAALARRRPQLALADLHAEVATLAQRAVPQALDRMQVAHALGLRLVQAQGLAGEGAAR